MFGLPTFTIGRFFGIPIEVDPSWLIAFVVIAGVPAFTYFPAAVPHSSAATYLLLGCITAVMLSVSIVVHELCHSLVARHFGIGVDRITLFVFGGVSQIREEPGTPRIELLMSFAGPAASLALAAVFFGASLLAPAVGASDPVWVPIQYIALINLILGVFNLLPGYPMDGGRVLHSYLWWATGDRALSTLIASWSGRIAALGLVGLGVLEVLAVGLAGLWPVLLGLFLLRLATEVYAQQIGPMRLQAARVDGVMISPLPQVDGALRASAAAAATLERRLPAVGVVSGGTLVGLLPTERAVALAARDAASAAFDDRIFFIDAADSAETALRRFASGVPALVAVDRGRAVGLVTPASVAALQSVPAVPGSNG